MPRKTIKVQALYDFLVEYRFKCKGLKLGPDLLIVYIYGCSAQNELGVALTLISPKKEQYNWAFRFAFVATNNKVEYKAIISI